MITLLTRPPVVPLRFAACGNIPTQRVSPNPDGDARTLACYTAGSQTFFNTYVSAPSFIHQYFPRIFKPGDKVLDIGASSGKDMACLAKLGVDVFGIEPVDEFRRQAMERFPELANRIEKGCLPTLDSRLNNQFDGVNCCAVWYHLPREQMEEAAKSIAAVLKPGGKLLLSTAKSRPWLDTNSREQDGRLITLINTPDLVDMMARNGLHLKQHWIDNSDGLNRPEHTWITYHFEKAL
jgi:SAM-dependent methyltransferase